MSGMRKQSKRGLSLSIQKLKKVCLPTNNLQDIFDFTISKQHSTYQQSLRNSLYKNCSNQQSKQKIRKLSINNLSKSLFSNNSKQINVNNSKIQKNKIIQADLILGGPKKKNKNNTFPHSISETFNCLKVVKQGKNNKNLNNNINLHYFQNTNHENLFQYIPIEQHSVFNKQYSKSNSKITYSAIRNYHMYVPYLLQQSQTALKCQFIPQYKQNYSINALTQSNEKVLTQSNQNINYVKINTFNKNLSQKQNNKSVINQNQSFEIKIIPPASIKQKQNLQVKSNRENKKRTSIFKDKLTQIQKKLDTLIISAKHTRKEIQERVQMENITK